MDGDVQQHYLAAEQAYSEGDFDQAEAIANALLLRLDSTTGSAAEQEACLAWRAFVALLLGHTYFHGLHQADKAEAHYQLVLASTPPDTLRDLAQQGLERCTALADQAASSDPPTGGSSAPVEGRSITTTAPSSPPDSDAILDPVSTLEHDLVRDPFLGTSSATTPSATATSAPMADDSATPWLQSVASLQNETNGMESVADASALPFETPVIDSGDADDHLPLTAANSDRETLGNNAKIDHDVAQEDINQIAAEETPPPIDEQPSERNPTAGEPVDLSPWLLRRTITFNER